MMKIELVKFEAQDVITASAGVVEPPKPAPIDCTCTLLDHWNCNATDHDGRGCDSPLAFHKQ